MVTRGDHVNGGCCFDYGNAETDNDDDGRGTMEALYFGTWGDRGKGKGPWVMADLECVLALCACLESHNSALGVQQHTAGDGA